MPTYLCGDEKKFEAFLERERAAGRLLAWERLTEGYYFIWPKLHRRDRQLEAAAGYINRPLPERSA